jgi:hypothetical protein
MYVCVQNQKIKAAFSDPRKAFDYAKCKDHTRVQELRERGYVRINDVDIVTKGALKRR